MGNDHKGNKPESANAKMKGDISIKIIQALSETAMNMADLFAVFISARYGSSLGHLEYKMRLRERARAKNRLAYEIHKQAHQRYYNLIAWLKRDGLIEEKKRGAAKLLSITSAGKKRLTKLLERKTGKLPDSHYEIKDSPTWTMVAFDIPEKYRRKRAWLRSALENMKFRMVQKSVWLGQIKIPESFLEDVRKLKLASFVEIFQITKTGSLRHVI